MRSRSLPRAVLLAAVAVLSAPPPGLSQASPAKPPAKAAAAPGEYAIYEFSPFLGYQWFQIYANERIRPNRLDEGLVFGVRFTQDFSKYVGLEESFTVGFNGLQVKPFGQNQFVKADARNYSFAINPVVHFTPRQSKFRPFITAGPAAFWIKPSDRFELTGGAIAPPSTLKSRLGPALVYGGGLKINASRKVGVRFDLRGTWAQGYEAGLPEFPTGLNTIYLPKHGAENALSATGGITFRWGHRSDYVPPPPPPPPPAPKPKADVQVRGIQGARDVCPGETVRLTVAASGWLPDQTPSYQWLVNGQPVPGATGSEFSPSTVDGSGTRAIAVRVSAGESSRTSQTVNMRIKEYAPPTVQFAVSPSTIPAGTRLPLSATARASECGGDTTLRYTASEGSVSGNTFDSSGVAFDTSNRLKLQSKVVKLTATATDQKGGTGSAAADVTVTLSPQARRLDDIVFPRGSARVNNCAKRLLLEVLTPMLRDDPGAQVILIGHRDEREKGKVMSTLDRRRALNSAAVLSAGTGICPQLDLSRVKVKWVGEDQSSAVQPSFCGASTNVREKGGQAVKQSDTRAQFRRVEVWIVPGGAEMPAGVSGLQDAPAAEVKKLGCPK